MHVFNFKYSLKYFYINIFMRWLLRIYRTIFQLNILCTQDKLSKIEMLIKIPMIAQLYF